MTTTTTTTTMATTTTTERLDVNGVGQVDVVVGEQGDGRVFLLLHGGAGPTSMTGFADLLADAGDAHVVLPTHPGFDGSERPPALDTVQRLAALYLGWLEQRDLRDVTVVGGSMGGWTAMEMVVQDPSRIGSLVLINSTGVVVDGHPITDVSALTLPEIQSLSFHDVGPFRVDPATLTPEQQANAGGNRAALAAYCGSSNSDPELLPQLSGIPVPCLVVWGESDGIVDVAHGRAIAQSIPGAQFHVLARAGHLPQLEAPEHLAGVIRSFVSAPTANSGAVTWSSTYTAETVASPQAVWASLRDLYTGTTLSDGSDAVEIHGPFEPDTRLSVTPAGADFVIECTIVEAIIDQAYAYQSHLDGRVLTSRHVIDALPDGGTRIMHCQEIAAADADAAGRTLGARITEDTPEAMQDLIAAAEERHESGDRNRAGARKLQ